MNRYTVSMFAIVHPVLCAVAGWNLLAWLGRKSRPRTWRDLPENIIKIIDEYSYDDTSKETISQIKHRHLQIKDMDERKSVLQSCYLSVAIDYFVNRDYRYALRAIKQAENAYRHLLKADQGYRRKAESLHYYTCLLWGIIMYLKGYDRQAGYRLKKCLKSGHDPAIEKFIATLK